MVDIKNKISAGLVPYRMSVANEIEFFLVHPGGPYNKNKDLGCWSVPKGEVNEGADFLDEAKREFVEETGFAIAGDFVELKPIKQKSGKVVHAWGIAANFDPTKLVSNTVSIEWPPRSNHFQDFPEVDRGEWFTFEIAKTKIIGAQFDLLSELRDLIKTAKNNLKINTKIC